MPERAAALAVAAGEDDLARLLRIWLGELNPTELQLVLRALDLESIEAMARRR
ncbi:MAG: hypothetical protein AAFZ87_06410 [Planctomycetota bacterium]